MANLCSEMKVGQDVIIPYIDREHPYMDKPNKNKTTFAKKTKKKKK